MPRLVKLGVAIGAQAEGAVRSHARRALAETMTPDEVRRVGLLALTTIGFRHTVAGLGWIDEVIASKGWGTAAGHAFRDLFRKVGAPRVEPFQTLDTPRLF